MMLAQIICKLWVAISDLNQCHLIKTYVLLIFIYWKTRKPIILFQKLINCYSVKVC